MQPLNTHRAQLWALVGIAFLAPLPLGSNRPVTWALWAGVFALMLAFYMAFSDARRIKSLRSHAPMLVPLLAAGLVQPLWGMVQIIPFGAAWLGYPADLPQEMLPQTISLAPDASYLAVLRMGGHVLLFALVVLAASRASAAGRVMLWLFIGITVHAVWAMINLAILGDVSIWGGKQAYLGVATGPFVNRNSFASYLGMGLVMGLCLLLDKDNAPIMRMPHKRALLAPQNLARLALGLCGLLIFITLLATQSRAGLLSAALGVLVAGAVMLKLRSARAIALAGPQRAAARRIWAALAALALAAALIFATGQEVLDRSIFTLADADGRLHIYQNALARIAERPLTGYGLDAFPLAYELGRSDDTFNSLIYHDAHSTYLENWVEGGVIFGSAMIVAALIYLRHLAHMAAQPARPAVPTAAACGVLALAAAHSLVDFSFEIEANVIILTIILAIGAAPFQRRSAAI